VTSVSKPEVTAEKVENQEAAQAVLRVALDSEAIRAFESMVQSLKAESYVRLTPSKFISFLTQFYFQHYFEKDRELLASEFFDSKEFVAAELRKVRDASEIEGVLEQSMRKVRRMQELKTKGGRPKRGPRSSGSDA